MSDRNDGAWLTLSPLSPTQRALLLLLCCGAEKIRKNVWVITESGSWVSKIFHLFYNLTVCYHFQEELNQTHFGRGSRSGPRCLFLGADVTPNFVFLSARKRFRLPWINDVELQKPPASHSHPSFAQCYACISYPSFHKYVVTVFRPFPWSHTFLPRVVYVVKANIQADGCSRYTRNWLRPQSYHVFILIEVVCEVLWSKSNREPSLLWRNGD